MEISLQLKCYTLPMNVVVFTMEFSASLVMYNFREILKQYHSNPEFMSVNKVMQNKVMRNKFL